MSDQKQHGRTSEGGGGGERIKKPLSAFIIFSSDIRPQIRARNPDMRVPDIAKALGIQWRSMSEAEKAPYQELSDADRARYAALSPKKRPDRVKKPRSAFIIFSSDARPALREQNPSMKITEVARELGRRWRTMSLAAQAPYQKRSDEDKARYARQRASGSNN